MESINTLFEKAKAEIISDMEAGIIPKNIENFSDLHDYVDANCYGGLCEETYKISKDFKTEIALQNKLDSWLKNKMK